MDPYIYQQFDKIRTEYFNYVQQNITKDRDEIKQQQRDLFPITSTSELKKIKPIIIENFRKFEKRITQSEFSQFKQKLIKFLDKFENYAPKHDHMDEENQKLSSSPRRDHKERHRKNSRSKSHKKHRNKSKDKKASREQSESQRDRSRKRDKERRSRSRDKKKHRSRSNKKKSKSVQRPAKLRQSKFSSGPPEGYVENEDNNPLLQGMNLQQFQQGQKGVDHAVSFEKQVNINRNILAQAGIKINDKDDEDEKQDKIQRMLNSTSITSQMQMMNPLYSTLADTTKIKRKIYVPIETSFNYTGLLIGPKGQNQKLLEERTGCKILVRGKGSQKEGQLPQPDDDEEQHVLIVGDTESQVAKACAEVERIIFADEETRNKIRQDQLKMVATMKNDSVYTVSEQFGFGMDTSLTTPYGPPSEDAYIIPVPQDCVGLVIGKGGDTIKMLQERSGARRVQVALENTENSDQRNVFVEGSAESVEVVKSMLAEIVDNQKKMKMGLTKGQNRIEIGIPLNMVGLVIGKGGETVKSINTRTGAFVALSREPEHQKLSEKILIIAGTNEAIEIARREVLSLVDNGVRHQQHKLMQSMGNQNHNNYHFDLPKFSQDPKDYKPPVSALLGNRPPPDLEQQNNDQQLMYTPMVGGMPLLDEPQIEQIGGGDDELGGASKRRRKRKEKQQ